MKSLKARQQEKLSLVAHLLRLLLGLRALMKTAFVKSPIWASLDLLPSVLSLVLTTTLVRPLSCFYRNPSRSRQTL